MTALPQAYAWLSREPGPAMLIEALKLHGIEEKPGAGSNPEILRWAAECGLSRLYAADSVPWCGLFVAVVAKRAGWDVVTDPLWARNWAKWGRASDSPKLGDVLVFVRDGGGHVGLYVGEDNTAYHVLGGNQSDKVCITRFLKSRLVAARRAAWRIAQPLNVRAIRLAAMGTISGNEA